MNVLDRFFRRAEYYAHKDRAQKADIFSKYGTQDLAKRRFPQTQFDILAQNNNANVRVCHRAIGEAIRSLPIQVVSLEVVDNGINEIVDMNHEVNAIIKHPNKELTFSEILHHNSDSYLGDGNAYCTMELVTGPNMNLELWPRDPRNVERVLKNGIPKGYKVGRRSPQTFMYQRSRVVHIRNMDVSDPLYGKPRHEAVRDEIMLDNLVNQFNKAFFENGATFSLMFTPTKNLTVAQHKDLMKNIRAEMTGMDNAFGLVLNRYSGSIEGSKQKHGEVAFLELLRMNREKIYGAFGLPPFRGGVMEYANYANALAQDKDFWLNTIKPIMTVILDSYNKQMVWPLFGDDIALRANYSAIPALKGTPLEQAKVHKVYLDPGKDRAPVLTVDEVREQLGFDPMPEAEKAKLAPAKEEEKPGLAPSDKDAEKKEAAKGAKPTDEEKKKLSLSIYNVLRRQRRDVMGAIEKFSVRGSVMCKFMNAEKEADQFFNLARANRDAIAAILPECQNSLRLNGTRLYRLGGLGGAFRPTKAKLRAADKLVENHLHRLNLDTRMVLQGILADCDKRCYSYQTLRNQVGQLFTLSRARSYTDPIAEDVSQQTGTIVHQQLADQSTKIIASKTRKEPAV